MNNVLRTLTITGGLAASLLIGAGTTSAAGNDSLLNLNDGLVENSNIFVSNDESNLMIDSHNDTTTDVNVESQEGTLDSNVDVVSEDSVEAIVQSEEESVVVNADRNANLSNETVVDEVNDTVSSTTEVAAEVAIGAGIEGKDSSATVNTDGNTSVTNETVVDEENDTVSSTTEAAAEVAIGAGIEGKDSSATVNTDGNTSVTNETVVDEENDTNDSTTKGNIGTSLNSVFENEDSSSFLDANNNTSIVNVLETNEESDSSSLALGTEFATNLGQCSKDTEIEESAKVMAAVSALIEAQSTEDSSRLGTEVDAASMVGLNSEDENSFTSMLHATAGIWVQSTQESDDNSSELELDLGLSAMSESIKN